MSGTLSTVTFDANGELLLMFSVCHKLCWFHCTGFRRQFSERRLAHPEITLV